MKKKVLLSIMTISAIVVGTVCASCNTDFSTEAKYYSVVFDAEQGGSIRYEEGFEHVIKEGENSKYVFAYADDGYEFIGWSDGNKESGRMVVNVRNDVYAKAMFKRKTYDVRYSALAGGSISGEKAQTVERGGSSTTVMAQAEDGYYFRCWSDGATNAVRSDDNINADISVSAEFGIVVSYETTDGGTIEGDSKQYLQIGDKPTSVTAKADAGYRFVSWSDGVTSETRADSKMDRGLSVTAKFEPIFEGGKGTAERPYLIVNYEQLKAVANFPAAYFKLCNNLDLKEISHEPLFTDRYGGFVGVFDGDNHTIDNLTISTESNYPSLFGINLFGEIKNLNFTNASLVTVNYDTTDEYYYAGILAAVSLGIIENVHVQATVNANGLYYDGVAVGALVGRAYGEINNCSVNVNMQISDVQRKNNTSISNPFSFGGMIGVGNGVNISNCEIVGSIETADSENHIVSIGGLLGTYVEGYVSYSEVTDCKTDVEIKCGDDALENVGGFICAIDMLDEKVVSIQDCIVNGDINAGYVGGFVYDILGTYIITRCSAIGRFTGYCEAAGFACYVYSQGTMSECFVDADISGFSAGGFIYMAIRLGSLEKCCVKADVVAEQDASGFIFLAADIISINYCHVHGSVTANRADAFAELLDGGIMNQCYCDNTVIAVTEGASFGAVRDMTVMDCYSLSNVTTTGFASKVDSSAGFIAYLANSQITNCYYAGVLTVNNVSPDSVYGVLIGKIRESAISDCHVLYNAGEIDVIGVYEYQEGQCMDYESYENIEDMYNLADLLNGQERAVWKGTESALPHLAFSCKHCNNQLEVMRI